jgi:hypothetical protein
MQNMALAEKKSFKRGKNFSYKETLSIKGSQKIGKN